MTKSDVRISKSITEIRVIHQNEKWAIQCSSGRSESFDGIVVASSPDVFQTVVGQLAPNYSNQLKKVKSLGVHVVILVNTNKFDGNYRCSLRRSKDNPFVALIEHTNFASESEYGGEHLLYLAKYVDTSSTEWLETDEQLVTLALRTCSHINPKFDVRSNIRSYVFRNNYAQPLMPINSSEELLSVKVQEQPNLYHGSMSHVYPWDRGTNFALELGERIANCIIKNLPDRK